MLTGVRAVPDRPRVGLSHRAAHHRVDLVAVVWIDGDVRDGLPGGEGDRQRTGRPDRAEILGNPNVIGAVDNVDRLQIRAVRAYITDVRERGVRLVGPLQIRHGNLGH